MPNKSHISQKTLSTQGQKEIFRGKPASNTEKKVGLGIRKMVGSGLNLGYGGKIIYKK